MNPFFSKEENYIIGQCYDDKKQCKLGDKLSSCRNLSEDLRIMKITPFKTIILKWNEPTKKGLEEQNIKLNTYIKKLILSFKGKKVAELSNDDIDTYPGNFFSSCSLLKYPVDNIMIVMELEKYEVKSIFTWNPSKDAKNMKIEFQPPLPANLQGGWTYANATVYKNISVVSVEDISTSAKGEKKSPRAAGAGKGRKKISPKKSPTSSGGRRSPSKKEKITCSSNLSDIRASPAFKNLKLKGKWKSRKGGKWRLRKDEVCEVLQLSP
jgi:hypothetical protein